MSNILCTVNNIIWQAFNAHFFFLSCTGLSLNCFGQGHIDFDRKICFLFLPVVNPLQLYYNVQTLALLIKILINCPLSFNEVVLRNMYNCKNILYPLVKCCVWGSVCVIYFLCFVLFCVCFVCVFLCFFFCLCVCLFLIS